MFRRPPRPRIPGCSGTGWLRPPRLWVPCPRRLWYGVPGRAWGRAGSLLLLGVLQVAEHAVGLYEQGPGLPLAYDLAVQAAQGRLFGLLDEWVGAGLDGILDRGR